MRTTTLLVLTLMGAPAARADKLETKEQFVARVYAPYVKSEHAPSVTKREAELFEPTLRALLAKDRREAHGEVGRLDGDPLCACQDYEPLQGFQIATTYSDPDQPELVVRFSNGARQTEIQVILRRTKAGWRIFDLFEKEQGSLRTMLGGTTARKTPAETTTYYHGPVVYTAAEGGKIVGNASSLVMRIVRPGSAEIEEHVIQAGRKPGERGVDHVAKLRRIGDSARFSATDAESTFSGTMTFGGPEWAYTRWTYDLQLAAGGTLVGAGTLGPEGLKTHKTIAGTDGKPKVILDETLQPIAKDRYEAMRATLLE